MDYKPSVPGQITVPTRNGTGVTIGTPELIEAERQHVQQLILYVAEEDLRRRRINRGYDL